jgi:D-glucosaminate-6-phosphate ammonia-lyase
VATTRSSIYQSLGATPVVNATGIYTQLGGGTVSKRTLEAMQEANRWFADMPELMDQAGRAIAELVGAEHARVTPGAAAGLALGAAAFLTRGEPEAVARLPETDGVVLVQRPHRYRYDRCIRLSGARLIEVDGDNLADALADGPAALAFPGHLDGVPGTVGLTEAVALARAAAVPVLADAAFMVDPPEQLRAVVATGADIVCVSSKYYGGPNAGGFVCGRREWVDAVAALDFVSFELDEEHRFGRVFKLDRETIVGVVEGLRAWFETDHDARITGYGRMADSLAERLAAVPGLELTPMCFTMVETLEPAPVNCLHIRVAHRAAAEVERNLREGDPSIRVNVIGDALVVVFDTVPAEHEELLAERLEAELAAGDDHG